MSKKAKKGALYDKEIQQLLDDGFLSSGDDEIEDEEFNDSDVSSGDDIDDENWTVPFEISESSSESETDDDLEDGDRSNSQANVSNIPITNAQNDSSVAGTSATNDNSNTAGNDPNATGKNDSDPPINLDDWHTLILKPTLLKFKGEEKVLLDNLSTQPTTPVEFFRLFFDNFFLDKIIGFSNEKVRLLTRFKPLNRRSPLRNFKPISREDLLKFLGLTMLMGNVCMPSTKHYWRIKSKLYEHPLFGNVMSKNRFETILRALRFYDVSERVEKKEKISYVLQYMNEKFNQFYSPAKQLSIDEVLLGFKGRLSYKQYIPLKRSRFGIKLYELCASNGYVLNIVLYTGKGTVDEDSQKEKGHAYGIVMKLLKGYEKKGHAVYLDNYYTSITLADDLFKHGTQLVGTLRSNRKGIPDFLKTQPPQKNGKETKKEKMQRRKRKQKDNQKLHRGESIFARKRHLLIQKWIDKKEIFMISSRHDGKFTEVPAKFGKTNLKPKVVAEYNRFMGGVGKADQLTSYYSSPRKTMKWQLKVFFHLMDLSLWNALYLFNFDRPKKDKLSYLEFRDSVIESCLGSITSAPPPVPPVVSTDHMPVKLSKRIRCRYCSLESTRSATWFCCSGCKQDGKLLGFCLDTNKHCFRKFHEEKLYQNL